PRPPPGPPPHEPRCDGPPRTARPCLDTTGSGHTPPVVPSPSPQATSCGSSSSRWTCCQPLIDAEEEPPGGGSPRGSVSVRREKLWPSLGTRDVRPWGESVAVYGEFRVAAVSLRLTL